MWYITIAAIVFILAIAPFVSEWMRPAISAKARHATDGEFAHLSQGITHFQWIGPARGPVAVLIHGLTTPSVGLEGIAEGLGTMGYRVLMYDLYGRGLSDAPRGKQDRAFFLQQLSDLLEHEKQSEELTLVGYSMGGAIATAFAAENQHSIKRLILLAGACVDMNESRFSRFCRRTPFLGAWVHGVSARGRILASIPRRSRHQLTQKVLVAQRQELNRRGYLPAVLSSRRGMLSEIQEEDHRLLGHEDVPVVAIWGEKDKAVPISSLGTLAKWNRAARQEVVEGADHGMPYTHDAAVIEALRSALRE